MKEERYIIDLDEQEQGVLIRSLNDERNGLIRDRKASDAVDDLIIKVGTALPKRHRGGRYER